MADIINAPDLPSEDEEDDDYDPSRQGIQISVACKHSTRCAIVSCLISHTLHRDADKGDEAKTKSKSGPKGRNKRLLETAGEDSDGEDDNAGQGSMYSKTAMKKAKVWPETFLPASAVRWSAVP